MVHTSLFLIESQNSSSQPRSFLVLDGHVGVLVGSLPTGAGLLQLQDELVHVVEQDPPGVRVGAEGGTDPIGLLPHDVPLENEAERPRIAGRSGR